MANKFLNIRYICGFKVRIEKYKPPKGPPQCHRCQQFSHVDKACSMNARCVKSGLNHLSKDCIKPREEEAKCANCSGGHPASYRGCPTYQRLKEKIKILKEKARIKFNPNIRQEPASPVVDLDNEDFPVLNSRGENLANLKNQTYAQIAANAEVDPVLSKNFKTKLTAAPGVFKDIWTDNATRPLATTTEGRETLVKSLMPRIFRFPQIQDCSQTIVGRMEFPE
ncbi:hypothetical protein J437_LFUL015831 [Ladona fulva]|uniref:Nucleic-acid-binding protein from mobile element jockey n=1 Tax=Ladona fulva TaxID=123851 RepID=A0A8K0P7I6_LADFU|nr:hypothetical protein J437_LFUL015831 [Ladona fulva]